MVYAFAPVIHKVPIYFPEENKTLELNLTYMCHLVQLNKGWSWGWVWNVIFKDQMMLLLHRIMS